ncbi:uncharacterized protein LOC127861814 isoform X2 [Dreissena polymorpha]|uniref:uncharacterized protein LOC127861814 isoform X2 n=1 Tax=Dreissena polymorpha TaxID=45954 RepID=UPI002264CBB1|nr:uncharacterized protein LOC127861814 isoform X2 [Dreissena polymorpha]
MSVRSYRSLSSRTTRSRPSSSLSFVESNFRVDTPDVPQVVIGKRSKAREITINDAPMMLLPKARVRDNLDYYDRFRRSFAVVADTTYQGLHISTIESVNGMPSIPQKSALKPRKDSTSRSEADSGFCSLKRSVTFDNLSRSQSTVYASDDDADNNSDSFFEDREYEYKNPYRHPALNGAADDFPEYLESFGNDAPVVISPTISQSRPPSRQLGSSLGRRRRHGHSNHDDDACEICGVVLSDVERVQKSFGKVDSFLDWVMARWGKEYFETLRGELQYVPRASTYKGHTPHFCNFVHQMQLHSKALNGTDSTGIPYSELGDDLTFVGESTEGKLVNKYRKNSNASSDGSINRGLTKSPKLEDYEHDSIPETKEDHVVSGTEGRPGSPSSLDGESRHGDDDSQQQQPVTGKRKVQFGSRYFQGMIGDSKSISEEGDEDNKSGRDLDYNTWDNGQVIKGASSQGHTDLDTTLRPPSPRDPPPSPELSKKKEPKEIPLPTTAPKTKDCKKKTKKPVERVRTMKATDEPPVEVQPTATEETRPPEVVLTVSDNVDSKRDIQVPDLPDLETKETNRKEKGKPKRHLIETEDDLLKPDLNDILNEQLRLSRPEFDWSNMETTNGGEEVKRHPQIKSWIQGRLALSQQSSRFELPMDMKRLETMTPQEYIRKHCIITSRRQNLYQKIFMKNKDKSATILYKDLDRSLKDVLVNTITSEQVQDVLKSLEIDEQTRVDQKLFYGVAAYAERVLYPKFVTEDTHDMPEYQREKIECADFCALNWKIHGVNVPKNMLNVLKQIT